MWRRRHTPAPLLAGPAEPPEPSGLRSPAGAVGEVSLQGRKQGREGRSGNARTDSQNSIAPSKDTHTLNAHIFVAPAKWLLGKAVPIYTSHYVLKGVLVRVKGFFQCLSTQSELFLVLAVVFP